MFDAAIFEPNKFGIDDSVEETQYLEKNEEPILNESSIKKQVPKKNKSKSYTEVLLVTFEKEDKNNIAPVNIYASVQAKLNTLKLLHPKKSKIDIVNSILHNFFDENASELNEEIIKYQANLKTFF